MFAVLNHLKNTQELQKALINLKNILKDEVKKCCENVGLVIKKVYENYDINKCGSAISKNLQFLICKDLF